MYRLTILLLLISCGGMRSDDVRGFIEGSYTRHFETEFAVGMDSVVIMQQGADHYTITKYSRFSRIKNGQWMKEESVEEKMAGMYDPDSRVINEQKKGKVIHFDADKRVMMIGASEYVKVK